MYRGRFNPSEEIGGPSELSRSVPQQEQAVRRPGTPRRIACIFVADFSLAAIVRANPELREQAVALAQIPVNESKPAGSPQAHSRLSQVSHRARASGLRTGMTVAQARALIPEVTIAHPSRMAERAAMDALVDVAESISPIVEEGEPGCLWIDLTGAERSFRHSTVMQDPEETIESAIAEEIIRRTHRIALDAAVGVAANKETAYLAARCGGARVIPYEKEREFLDWMPLDLIGLGTNERGDDVETMLKRLGIRRLGDLARLDGRAVGSRFGSRGVELVRLARGEGSATVIARPQAEIFAEAVELEYGIETLEPLDFVMRAMIERLTERLALRGLVAGDLTLSLGLADRRRDERRVAVAAATNEIRALLTLLNLSLESSPPPAAVETIRLSAEPRKPRPAQADMFLPPMPAPDRLEAAIARIAALCGPERVGTIAPANSYRPEAVRVGRFAPPPISINGKAQAGVPAKEERNSVARMVMRTVRPAEEVEVMCARETPEFVRGKSVCARVVSAAGPWRRQGEWWVVSEDPPSRFEDTSDGQESRDAGSWQAQTPHSYARDYYELALEDGGVYRMYCDLCSGKWFVDGFYD
jgi:protein ImuB